MTKGSISRMGFVGIVPYTYTTLYSLHYSLAKQVTATVTVSLRDSVSLTHCQCELLLTSSLLLLVLG